MEKILIGKYVNTHGIKGEIRIKSNFKYKNKVFVSGMKIIINNQEFVINTYRPHKEFDMVTLEKINNINDILPLKGSNVYVLRNSLNLNDEEYLDNDLLDFEIYVGKKLIGTLTEIRYLTDTKKILVVAKHLIPFELVQKIDFKQKKIFIEEVSGLI